MVTVYPVFLLSIIASVLVMPFVLFDFVRLSNRFAGPMFRLRRCMQDLADGKRVEPIHFRDGDFWQEIADAFNGILARMDAARTISSEVLPSSAAITTDNGTTVRDEAAITS